MIFRSLTQKIKFLSASLMALSATTMFAPMANAATPYDLTLLPVNEVRNGPTIPADGDYRKVAMDLYAKNSQMYDEVAHNLYDFYNDVANSKTKSIMIDDFVAYSAAGMLDTTGFSVVNGKFQNGPNTYPLYNFVFACANTMIHDQVKKEDVKADWFGACHFFIPVAMAYGQSLQMFESALYMTAYYALEQLPAKELTPSEKEAQTLIKTGLESLSKGDIANFEKTLAFRFEPLPALESPEMKQNLEVLNKYVSHLGFKVVLENPTPATKQTKK
ncbi:hypothetical protein [Psittacicella hinzii]|uniref:Uncharacterized protein n=1 Tax=Psittacicella hinzii TaxID=2028575 RepID=A0A3A1YPY9_9GAMM|nr:hypothetical protein [Psittacicella hinzii]RIY39685.1 hypothetical protein CKF58_01690 [Psittacicella hinzii]